MSISQIVAAGITGAVLSLTLRKINPEAALFVGLMTGIFIFLGVIGRLSAVIDVLTSLSDAANVDAAYISIILKIIGVSYIAEFGIDMCKDAGEAVVASKIELAGKVIIMTISIPVITGVLDMIMSILP